MKIIIHQDSLSQRGDSQNAEYVAKLLKEFFDIPSLIVAPKNNQNNFDRIKELRNRGFSVSIYNDLNSLWDISKKFNTTHAYFMNNGRYSNVWIPDTFHLTHAEIGRAHV